MQRYILVFLAVFTLTPLVGQEYSLSSYKMTVSGTSTIHDWTSTVTDVKAEAKLLWDQNRLKAIEALEVKVRSESIISGKGSVMDNKTWTALKKDEYPNIIFKLKKAAISPDNPFKVTAFGNLSIAGSTRAVELEAEGVLSGNGLPTFTGQYRLLMSDFGIDPPTALMGSLQTGDEITIDFEVVFSKSNPSLGLLKK